VIRVRRSPLLPVTLGVLAGLAAALQLAPLWGQGIGLLLAAAATLPAAVGTALAPRRCIWFLLVTAAVIGLASREELFVFMTGTGPLGMVLGLTLDRRPWGSAAGAALVLAGGMALMPLLAGVYAFGGVEQGWPMAVRFGVYLLFALGYSRLWVTIFRRVWTRVSPTLRYTRRDRP
jgi:hypothetical protein